MGAVIGRSPHENDGHGWLTCPVQLDMTADEWFACTLENLVMSNSPTRGSPVGQTCI